MRLAATILYSVCLNIPSKNRYFQTRLNGKTQNIYCLKKSNINIKTQVDEK